MAWRFLLAILLFFAPAMTGCATKGTNPFAGFFAARELADSEPYGDSATGHANTLVSQDEAAQARADYRGSGNRNAPSTTATTAVTREDPSSIQLTSGVNASPAATAATYTAQPALIVLDDEKQLSNLMQSAQGPVVLDFFTTWCGPCKRQSKILHQMESVAQAKGATIVKVDAEKFPAVARQFKVKAYPTLVAVKGGAVAQHQTGVADEQTLERWFSL
ncbi:MAG: thioredoxin family protein [Planctomycetota bacterium]